MIQSSISLSTSHTKEMFFLPIDFNGMSTRLVSYQELFYFVGTYTSAEAQQTESYWKRFRKFSTVTTLSWFVTISTGSQMTSTERGLDILEQEIVTSHLIIILSCRQHRYPWSSLANPPNHSSLLVGPQGYIPYPHRVTVCRSELVALLLLSHVKWSIGKHHLWARPCFSSSVLQVSFI